MEHKIIHIENYLLVVSDDEIKEGDWIIDAMITKNVIRRAEVDKELGIWAEGRPIKIIAHLPLNNSPILQGVDLLPPLEQEDDVEELAQQIYREGKTLNVDYISASERSAFINGYNKAKEKYKYTEEDIRKAIDMARDIKDNSAHDVFTAEDVSGCTEVCTYGWRNRYKDNEIIKSLSKPKLPVAFSTLDQWYNPKTNQSAYSLPEITGLNDNDGCYMKPKTTTNNLGQTEWVGEYIY